MPVFRALKISCVLARSCTNCWLSCLFLCLLLLQSDNLVHDCAPRFEHLDGCNHCSLLCIFVLANSCAFLCILALSCADWWFSCLIWPSCAYLRIFCALVFPAKCCLYSKTTFLLSYWSCGVVFSSKFLGTWFAKVLTAPALVKNAWAFRLEMYMAFCKGLVWFAMVRVYTNLFHVSSTHNYTAKGDRDTPHTLLEGKPKSNSIALQKHFCQYCKADYQTQWAHKGVIWNKIQSRKYMCDWAIVSHVLGSEDKVGVGCCLYSGRVVSTHGVAKKALFAWLECGPLRTFQAVTAARTLCASRFGGSSGKFAAP